MFVVTGVSAQSYLSLIIVPQSSLLGYKMGQGRASSLPVLVPHLLALSSVMYFEVLNKSEG